jgi:peroxiredoxin
VGAWIAWHAGDQQQTRSWLEALSPLAHAADLTLLPFSRLRPILEELQLASSFAKAPEAASDIGDRPSLDSLGPGRWSPYPAPTWSLSDAQGKTYNSKQFRGKPTVIIFYLGLGCLHCVEQLQVFSPLVEEYAKSGIDVIAISTESRASLQTALSNYGKTMNIPLLTNPELDLFKSMRCFDDFENQPLHGTFALDRQGRVVWQDVGPEPFMDAEFLLREVVRLDDLYRTEHQTAKVGIRLPRELQQTDR